MVTVTNSIPRKTSRSKRLWAGIGALLTAGLITDVISGAVYGPLITSIMADTNFTASEVGWFFNAATIGTAVSVALTSRMGDIYGSRKVLIVVSTLALIGTAVAGLMSSFWPLILGRFLMGFSVGIPLSWGIIRPEATATQTQRIAVWLGTCTALFAPVAVVLGGLFGVLGFSWRSVTWLMFGLFALQLFFALASRNAPIQARTTTITANKLDWIGAIGLGLWVTSVLLGVNAGPEAGWTSPTVLTYFAIGAVLCVAWIFQQRRATVPMISFENMDRRQTATGYLSMLTVAFLGTSFYVALPNMMQNPTWGLGLDSLTSTYPLLMVFPGTLVAAQLVKFLMPRIGPKALLPLTAIATLAVTLGFAFAHGSYWIYFLWCFMYGALVMILYTSGYMLIASSSRQDNSSSVFGVLTVMQYLTVALSTVIVFIAMRPGPDGFAPESSYITLWVGFSIFLVVMAFILRVMAPRELKDLHAKGSPEEPTGTVEDENVLPPPSSVSPADGTVSRTPRI